jgi:hypothetical protein
MRETDSRLAPAFTRRSAAWLAVAAGFSLAAAGVLGVFGDELSEPPSFGADGWSRSALGHRAFLDLLGRLGRPVLVSRHHTAAKAGDGALVALLEPELGEEGGARDATLDEIDESAARLFVVLPKRTGAPDPLRPRWVGSTGLVSIPSVDRILRVLDLNAEVVRPERPIGSWSGPLPAPSVDRPQLLRSEQLEPLVECAEGILAGELVVELEDRRWHAVVLADPDLIATHGLGRGENAALALALLDRLGAGEGPVVVDETLHGHDQQPSIVRELLRFPLVLATLQALVAGLLLAWAALVQFGRPHAPPQALAPGKAFLVDNTAELLRAGGHVAHAAAAYLRAAREEVLARLRPPGASGGPPEAWLARIEAARGREGALRGLERRVQAIVNGRRGAEGEAVRTAQEIHRWREELTDGAAGDPRPGRVAQG